MVVLRYQLIMQFHTLTSNLIPACRPLQSEPLVIKLYPYVPSTYLCQLNITATNLIISLLNFFSPSYCLGTFNAHSTLWGCSKTDLRGKIIEDLLLKLNLSILNDGSNTYLYPATGYSSAIDLSIASPSLYLDFSWEVVTDLHGSDHFPICIHSYTTLPYSGRKKQVTFVTF